MCCRAPRGRQHRGDVTLISLQVSCGPFHAAAIMGDGRLFTWGDGLCGKLGHPTLGGSQEPRHVEALRGLRVRESLIMKHSRSCKERGGVVGSSRAWWQMSLLMHGMVRGIDAAHLR